MKLIKKHLLNLFLSISVPVFKPEELRQALMPTLESLYRQDPESLPFRQPVDPMVLGNPVSTQTRYRQDPECLPFRQPVDPMVLGIPVSTHTLQTEPRVFTLQTACRPHVAGRLSK